MAEIWLFISGQKIGSTLYNQAILSQVDIFLQNKCPIKSCILLFWPTVARRRRLESDLDERSFSFLSMYRVDRIFWPDIKIQISDIVCALEKIFLG